MRIPDCPGKIYSGNIYLWGFPYPNNIWNMRQSNAYHSTELIIIFSSKIQIKSCSGIIKTKKTVHLLADCNQATGPTVNIHKPQNLTLFARMPYLNTVMKNMHLFYFWSYCSIKTFKELKQCEHYVELQITNQKGDLNFCLSRLPLVQCLGQG